MCSSYDEGVVVLKSFLVSYDEIFIIVVCDEYGVLFWEVKDKNGFKYKFNVFNIVVGLVLFFNLSECIFGSLVIIVIVLGLSFFILFCVSLNNLGWE